MATRKRNLCPAAGLALTLIATGIFAAPAAQATETSDSTAAAVESYRVKHSAPKAVADDVIADQQVITDILDEQDIEVGTDADVWIDPHDSGQTVNIRTQDHNFATQLTSSKQLKRSDIQLIDSAPVATEEKLSSRERHAAVSKISPNVQGIHTRSSDGALIVETMDSLNDADLSEIAEATGLEMVEAETLDEAPEDSLTIRGGASLGSCTSGFAATFIGEIGFLTARHCPSPLNVYDSATSDNGDSAAATSIFSTYKRNADISFYKVPASGNSLSSTFYGNNGAVTDLGSGPVDVGEGFTLCHRGITTAWQCGETTSIAYQPTWDDACIDDICNAVFVRVDADQEPGDSGGPWVSGSSPAGIHKGGASTWSVYSKLSYALFEDPDDPKLFY